MTDKKSPNIRINKVYTRTGDAGRTRLIGGEKRWKDDARVEAYGTVDELNSEIGLCRELLKEQKEDQFSSLICFLKSVQNELFNLGSQLAAAEDRDTENLPQLSDDAISKLETEIDTVNESLSELTSFVLPGGSVINAQFHMARNVCRRAERRTVTLSRNETVVPENIRYLNRLSDALFVWSRWVSHILGDTENFWNPNH
ncbi:MAG TPA: cob(I)yrinic acid a,c-diamide adenosyltransferase [Candidatus Marinimicrobia bacterium]|nr:cob(I)yrinic acid a,c-diamide adenosyltransferase [Candidatus Neomarinimicrobiota bacterium]MDP7465098.1 cob(I)yrinic acid a,c-diamide adenosyltransferase [Candidatus Neomarinimicrobiota bacterium]HJM83967.1 cob(I)yrinic acid a,c-diamide adenosyltransferase [Candidatus Neomarinimicrobiota bacterium]